MSPSLLCSKLRKTYHLETSTARRRGQARQITCRPKSLVDDSRSKTVSTRRGSRVVSGVTSAPGCCTCSSPSQGCTSPPGATVEVTGGGRLPSPPLRGEDFHASGWPCERRAL